MERPQYNYKWLKEVYSKIEEIQRSVASNASKITELQKDVEELLLDV